MPNNFKLTGDYYVSIDGSDSNNGLTKDTPKRTVQAGLNLMTTNNKTLIIGAGVYKETVSSTISSSTLIIKADGEVIIEALNTYNSFFSIGAFGFSFYNITFRNYLRTDSTGSAINMYGPTYYNCKFINCNVIVSTGSVNTSAFFDCQFINVTCNNYALAVVNFTRCIFFNCQFFSTQSPVTILKDCYLGKSSLILYNTATTTNINYNNFDDGFYLASGTASAVTTNTLLQDVNGFYYNPSIASGGSGTISDPFGRSVTQYKAFNFINHRILYPTFNANSFSSDPKFNDIQAQDFTLQATSPHIAKASDGINNIGGTKYATRYSAKGSEFNTSAVSVSGLAFVGNDWTVSGGTTGEVVSAPILISSTTKVLQKISYNGLLEFNKLVTGGTAGNRNVPDQDIYTTGTQGANPDRLVYYLRYSTQSAQPATNAEWDNGGYWTAGNYGVFEWNTKPSIDNAFLGNGDPAFNSGVTATFLNVTWIQLKVKLRNNYA
jgi:hypothetical protein